jgi:hypothetical protein
LKLFKRVKPTQTDITNFHIFEGILRYISKKNTYILTNVTEGFYTLLKKNGFDCVFYKDKREVLLNPLNNHKNPTSIDCTTEGLIKLYKRIAF